MTARVSLSRRTAQALLDFLEPPFDGPMNDHVAELERALAVSEKKRTARATTAKSKASKRSAKNAETAEIRAAVFERAAGRCEAWHWAHGAWERCDARPLDLDHQRGRARAQQTTENTWALCFYCDRGAKTLNKPSRAFWLRSFIEHCKRHGYRSEQARAERDLAWVEAKAAASEGRG